PVGVEFGRHGSRWARCGDQVLASRVGKSSFESPERDSEPPTPARTSAVMPGPDVPPDVPAPGNPELARVIAAWPTLTDPIRRAVLALIGFSAGERPGTRIGGIVGLR